MYRGGRKEEIASQARGGGMCLFSFSCKKNGASGSQKREGGGLTIAYKKIFFWKAYEAESQTLR